MYPNQKEGIVIHNPFLKEGLLTRNASVNKLIIAEMPVCSVTQKLTGKSAQDIFSTDLFIREIKASAARLHLDISTLQEKSLPLHLEDCLKSSDTGISAAAGDILKLFGERLAVILLCLKEGTAPNRLARRDWTDEHWHYWNSLERVILVGGLSSPPLGEQLKYYIEEVFALSGKQPYEIILGKDSTYAGLKGCAAFLKNSDGPQVHLIFDYGQSFIKRSYVIIEKGQLKDIAVLEKTLSRHAAWDVADPVLEQKEALLLNEYFLDTITRTIDEVEAKGLTIHPHIILSIANYVKDGAIVNRGGYGKLRLIAPNYSAYLSAAIRDRCGKDFYFTLVHDGTAMAAGYSGYTQAVCLSLGTAFGVGFP